MSLVNRIPNYLFIVFVGILTFWGPIQVIEPHQYNLLLSTVLISFLVYYIKTENFDFTLHVIAFRYNVLSRKKVISRNVPLLI